MGRQKIISTTELAAILGIPVWRLRRLYADGTLTEPGRVGGHRVVHEADVPAIRRALVAAGGVLAEQDAVGAK